MALLVLDDDAVVLQAIQLGLGDQYKLLLASSFSQAKAFLESEDIEGAIIDINLGTGEPSGIDFLVQFKERYPDKPAIIESGERELSTVVKCIKMGADDYLEKPFDRTTLQLKISKVFSDTRKTSVFKRAFEKSRAIQKIIGDSEGIRKAMKMLEQAGPMRVLLYGETGVGKTPFAWYSNLVVSQLDGQVRPFEQINCACLNAEQFQDQLFGHKKGAFTGAIADKRGLVELATGGDLFLDEIGDMPLDVQAHFLTFLDSMEYYRLGDDRKRRADVRILSATNKNLRKMVDEGKFRKDLYSRISQVIVEIPPLRDRASDVPLLFEHFVQHFAGFPKPYDPALLETLGKYRWEEGNVRELRDVVEFLCITSRNSKTISSDHLNDQYRPLEGDYGLDPKFGEVDSDTLGLIASHGLDHYLNSIEKRLLDKYLGQTDENLDNILKELRLSRATFYRRLKKYDIPAGKRWDA